ncbi:MurR/RpiR family transcriptional regulator [Acerihabitans sp. TG2]|uniref:MurR/RpiR family transcriptional regulator n=1 Tax=Acerihabitans sp. TG2 TaxID=3096008 RepID=UPI002B23EACD|nr:MurR/RpiR family transcriptional regulator [Acerihabitans sp. TG2]MEA9391904.1 MurR/RpiR family transcriptional regulator [Acerihabitans sp. TG2]
MVTVANVKKRPTDVYGERFRCRRHVLSPRLLAVADYTNQNRHVIMEHTALQIAAATQTSDATVVRAIQALGFTGLRDLKRTLENQYGPTLSATDKMSSTVLALSQGLDASIDFVLQGHQRGCLALSEPHNRQAMARALQRLQGAQNVGIFGIGASSILADYAARLFSRIGTPAYPLNRTGVALAEQLIGMRQGDVLIMMAQRKAHREGLATLREAKRLGVPTILLTWAGGSPFCQQAHTVILIPRGGEGRSMPLHGPVLVCLEMMILALASTTPRVSIAAMERLHDIYHVIGRPGHG